MQFLNAIQGVLSIILMIGVGYILSYFKWFDDKSAKLLSKLVVNISLPAYMMSYLKNNFNKNELEHQWKGLIIPVITIITTYLLAQVVAKLAKVPKERFGAFCSMFALSNTILVGLPVNISIFGEKSTPYVLLYYMANTTIFWTVGVYGISVDGGYKTNKIFSIMNIRHIFSPPLIGFLFAIILILLGIKLPVSIMDTCKYLGNLTTPLSMIFIGIIIYSTSLKDIKFDTSIVLILLGRFAIAPALVFASACFMSTPLLMKSVFVIQSAMPTMSQTSIIAETYNADYKYSAVMTTITTILSLIFIPFYVIFLGKS